MNVEVDHYVILGLPSGVEGAKLSQKEIKKAYLTKALECHPDKRHDDPNAHDEFQKLKNSYEILKDEKTRKIFDHLLRVKTDKVSSGQNSKRRKMASDLEKREQAAYASQSASKAARYEEEMIHRENKRTITLTRAAMHANKKTPIFKKKKNVFPSAQGVKSQTLGLSNFVGAEFEAYENLVLAKLRQV